MLLLVLRLLDHPGDPTCHGPPHTALAQITVSAFGAKRTFRRTRSRPHMGVKRTWPIAVHMSAFDPKRHCPAFYVAARSESQLYQNICLSRYDAVSSAAGGWPVNGAPPFPPGRRRFRLSAPGAVRHDVAHQVAHVVLQISDDVLDDVSDRDHAHDLARVQHW